MDAVLIYLFGGLPVGLIIIYAVIALVVWLKRLIWGSGEERTVEAKAVSTPVFQTVATKEKAPIKNSGPVNPLTGVPDP